MMEVLARRLYDVATILSYMFCTYVCVWAILYGRSMPFSNHHPPLVTQSERALSFFSPTLRIAHRAWIYRESLWLHIHPIYIYMYICMSHVSKCRPSWWMLSFWRRRRQISTHSLFMFVVWVTFIKMLEHRFFISNNFPSLFSNWN